MSAASGQSAPDRIYKKTVNLRKEQKKTEQKALVNIGLCSLKLTHASRSTREQCLMMKAPTELEPWSDGRRQSD